MSRTGNSIAFKAVSALVGVTVAIGVTTISIAANGDEPSGSDRVINACYLNPGWRLSEHDSKQSRLDESHGRFGYLRVVEDLKQCTKSEAALSWNIGGAEGPQGPAGEQGLPGDQGPAGPAGDQGEPGPAGPQGEQGIVGPDGPSGSEGPQGAQGEPGPVGPAGPQGEQGQYGPIGPVGPQGPQGEAGPQGEQGLAGMGGPIGPEGPQGEIGEAGPEGPQGEAGPAGIIGATGRAAYVVANDLTSAHAPYSPLPESNWSTAGTLAEISWLGVGKYNVRLPKMMTVGSATFGGTVQVASISNFPPTQQNGFVGGGTPPPHCFFVGHFITGNTGNDLNLRIDCAHLVLEDDENAMFSLLYVQ